MVISGGKIKVTTSGYNGEGIESKNYLNISGGEIYVDAYDDGITDSDLSALKAAPTAESDVSLPCPTSGWSTFFFCL